MVILLDTNIILDHLILRKPFSDTAESILRLCYEEKCEGYIAAHTITNIFYILRKHFSIESRKKMLIELCEFINVAGIQRKQIVDALMNEDFDDVEDRLQVECATKINASYIVTRNVSDFIASPIPAIQPVDFLALITEGNNAAE